VRFDFQLRDDIVIGYPFRLFFFTILAIFVYKIKQILYNWDVGKKSYKKKIAHPLPKVSVNVSCLSWAVAVVVSVRVAIIVGFAV
jgi:hypothetical protein